MCTDENMIVPIPAGITVDVKDGVIKISGSLGTNTRKANTKLLNVSKKESGIDVEPIKKGKLVKKAMQAETAFANELKGDMLGVTKQFEIKMKTVFAHFPMTLEVKGDKVFINNLIGERAPRIANICTNAKVEVKGADVRVYGISRDAVSQTAANIRIACKIRNKDDRSFQDGTYYEIE
jgi:large subunit ribosomal protein L6